jgi:hypothetical protein
MKRIYSILISLSVLILTLSGCGSNANQQAVANTAQQVQKVVKDTPHQVGQKGTISASVTGMELDSSYKDADIVAEVKICEWLGERQKGEELQKTIFRASLEKTFKNSVDNDLKEIKLIQDGNSDYTIENYPLFKNNDKLLLYLKKAVGEGYENTYWILGGQTGVFRIINTNGQDYAVKQVGDCPELSEGVVTGNSDNKNIQNTLAKSYSVEFPNLDKYSPKAYNLEAVENFIKEQNNK